MKKRLFINNQHTDFYQPYYIHDYVTIFDKNTNSYVDRRRATGISISDNGEIIIAFAVCSDTDLYSKPKARNIITNRIESLIRHLSANNKFTYQYALNNAFYFPDISAFKEFTNMFDISASYFFTPNQVIKTNKHKDTITDKVITTNTLLSSPRENISYAYWHYEFVVNTFTKFMSCLTNEPTAPPAEPVDNTDVPF